MSEIVEGSQRTAEALRYFWAVQECKALEIGQSLLLNSSFDLDFVKLMLPSIVGMSLVAIDWTNCIEIQRLPDGIPTNFVHALIAELHEHANEANSVDFKSKQNDLKKGCDEIKRFVKQYVDKPLNFHKKYDSKLKESSHAEGFVTYAYLQRRCAPLAVFRKNSYERRFLTACLDVLIEEKFFSEISQAEAFSDHGTKGRMFKVLK